MGVPFTDIKSLYIDGRWEKPTTGLADPVYNPATEEVIGEAPVGGKADVEAAVGAAREAFDRGPWPRMSYGERISVLRRFSAALETREQKIRALLRAEAGSTDVLTNATQWGAIPKLFDHTLKLAEHVTDEPLPLDITPNAINANAPPRLTQGVVIREPRGVVAAVTPYNFPLQMNIQKIAPALVTGNTVVLKPSPFTPFSALLLGEVAHEVCLPKGVLNIVTGGIEAGELLTTAPQVDMVTFTGSDTVGAAIMAQAAPTLKRIHFELGGKSALIVRADANIEMAAMIAVSNIALHAGQGCALNTRWIVHNSIRPAFVAACRQTVPHFKIGNPDDPTSVVGPLIREGARKRTEGFVEGALEAGARLVVGGRRPEGLKKGWFYEPTIFDDVDNRSRLAQFEVFGPIGAIIGFDTDDEAVELANDSNFGLHGGIVTSDIVKGIDLARRIRTGQVWINGGSGGMQMSIPFGGYKRSGIGREMGPHWLDEFLEIKAISCPIM